MIYVALKKYHYDDDSETIIKVCSSYELAVKAIVEDLIAIEDGWRFFDTYIEMHQVDVGYVSRTSFNFDANKQMILEYEGKAQE